MPRELSNFSSKRLHKVEEHRTASFWTVAFPELRHPMPLQYSRNAVICKSFSQNTNKSQRLARTPL